MDPIFLLPVSMLDGTWTIVRESRVWVSLRVCPGPRMRVSFATARLCMPGRGGPCPKFEDWGRFALDSGPSAVFSRVRTVGPCRARRVRYVERHEFRT